MRVLFWFLLSTLIGVGSIGSGLAQIASAVVVGRVTDSSHAVMPGAEVEMKRLATNQVFRALTTDTGDYTIRNLPIDTYELKVSMPGFKTEIRGSITLEIGRTSRIDVQLSPGGVNETVEVSAEAPVLKTESPELGQVVNNKVMVGLPVRGRDWMGFVALIPGVAPSRGSYGGGGLDATGFNVAGQRRSDNMMYLDGGIVTQGNGATTFFPSLDALQEIEVKTGLYSAEFGIKPGGQISTITKSGTNKPHGTLFEFHRNDNLNARNFFDQAAIPEFKTNLFGATLGAPIVIPRVFDGRDRAWFFISYAGERRRRFRSLTGVVPTLEERAGRFTTSIVDPNTRQPFPDSTIPASRISPVAQKIIPLWPEPNTAGRGFNFTSPSSVENVNSDQIMTRVDLSRSQSDRWSAHFVYDSTPSVLLNPIDAFTTVDPKPTWIASLKNSRTFGGSWVNDASIHYFLRRLVRPNIARAGFGSSLGVPILTDLDRDSVPTLSVTGLLTLGGRDLIGGVPIGSWEIRESVAFNKGAHAFKFGYHGRKHFNNEVLRARASYNFIPRYTGSAFGDFLLGFPANTAQGSENNRSHAIQNSSFLYFQDSWRATSRLTLSLGLRYEYRGPWKDKRGFATNFNPVTGQFDPPLQSLTLQPWETGRYQTDVPLISWTKAGWLPRLGVAYRLTDKLIVRSGYGAYANEPVYAVIESFGTNPRPNAERLTFLSDATIPLLTFTNPYNPQTAGGGLPNATGSQRVLPQAMTHSWGLTLQYEVTPRTVFEIGYQGSQGVHEPNVVEFNDARPGTGPRQQRRPYPGFQTIRLTTADGTNTTHGMQLRFEHKPGREGLSTLLAYTWMRAIDTVGGRLGIPGDPATRSRNVSLGRERGRGEGDIPSRLALTLGYEFPFGPGKPFLTDSVLGKVAGGWTIYSALALQSGPFVTAVIPTDRLDVGSTASSRPDRVRDPNLSSSERTAQRWFDTTAFALPAAFTYGNAGRSIIKADGIANLDLAVLRFFKVSESTRFELRFEAFNAANHTNFAIPGTSFGTSTFGVVGSALDSREIQIGIKFHY
jgi:outer membrane receptor protein involved in Fe transport